MILKKTVKLYMLLDRTKRKKTLLRIFSDVSFFSAMYKGNGPCDVYYDSSLDYEIAVLRFVCAYNSFCTGYHVTS